jgi:citrate lyase subunit beta/citryl-CoA lyase
MVGTLLPRSYLYVPGNATEKLAKALTRGADALVIDLEDSVPSASKAEARSGIMSWLESIEATNATEVWIRVNPGEMRWEDIEALHSLRWLTGFVLAKTETSEDVARCARMLAELGDDQSLLMPLLETAAAILDSRLIASQPRVRQLQIGEVDLAADVGMTPGPDSAELHWARAQVVFGSSAAGIHPPVGAVSVMIDDDEGLARSTKLMQRAGFMGRACIHPRQVTIVNEVLLPSEEEVREAEGILLSFADAQVRGLAVATDSTGRMIDPAVIRNAEHTIRMAARGGRDE